jgi:hypothetical protein
VAVVWIELSNTCGRVRFLSRQNLDVAYLAWCYCHQR